MADTHERLIDHAGPWALARADLGNGRTAPALVSRDRILDLSARPETAGARTVTELLERWDAVHHDRSDGRSAEQVRADAAAAMDTRLRHPPFVFTGLPSAVCGPYDDVVLPHDGEQPDWELELAAVIGRQARRVAAEALGVVAGWVIVNDLTLRDKVFRRDAGPLGADWLAAKNSPTFLPTGPVLVP